MERPKGSAVAEQPEKISLASLSDEELKERLNPATPAPQADKVTAEPEPPAPATEETPEKAEPVEVGKVDLVAENAKLQKQLENLQQVYGRQSNELGDLRAKLKAKPTPEDFDVDPIKASENLQEHQKQVESIKKLEQEQEMHATAMRNMQFITNHAPDLNANAPILKEVLVQVDKLGEGDVNKFFNEILLQNPWGVYQLNERAKLFSENRLLQAEVEKLKKAPKETVSKIAEISKMKSNVSAGSGASSEPGKPPSPSQIAQLSDDEIKQRLKQFSKGN